MKRQPCGDVKGGALESYAPPGEQTTDIEILSFGNSTRDDRHLLRRFVGFHWDHYESDPQYIPLLDYEHLGFRVLGITGFFEPKNVFFDHADIRFFLAQRGRDLLGRCTAFVNHNHNRHWHDRVGFFGHFEVVNDVGVAGALLGAAESWLESQGMDTIRGPQNFPVNEATPGFLTDGFDSRPVIYYGYNKPYYATLVERLGFEPIKRVRSWEVAVMNPMEEKLERLAAKIMERFDVTVETWSERSLNERKREMFSLYNEAWGENFGFVPFTQEEFYSIIDDMLLIMDKKLFMFLYVKGELAAFFGGVPNIFERLKPIRWCRRCELLRALKMLLTKNRIRGFRVGYLGVDKKYRRLGLDGVMLWKQKQHCQGTDYVYADLGWVLEDNKTTVRLIELMSGQPSKTYTIFQRSLTRNT
jgi:hypothetical protein